MSSNDRAAPPLGLAKTLQAAQDAQRRRAQAHLISLEIYRAADKRAGGDDRRRPGLSVQAKSARTSED